MEDNIIEKQEETIDADEEKGQFSDACNGTYPIVPFGALSFRDVMNAERSAKAARAVRNMTGAFPTLVQNILSSEDVEDKGTAIKALADEFVSLVEDEMSDVIKERRYQPLTDALLNKLSDIFVEKAKKTEDGVAYPASDYAYVPDPQKPSTWKLRMTESPGKITKSQLGKAAAAFSPGGHRGRRVQIPSSDIGNVKTKLRAEYKKLGVEPDDIPVSIRKDIPMMVWKEDGDWYWFAVYSNNFRDSDHPPEIIAQDAHLDFVKAVDKGDWPMPELYPWHVPYPVGIADMVGYDVETGMAYAAGHWYKEYYNVAQTVDGMDTIMSHAMPSVYIRRDDDDKTVITQYRSKEFSFLPFQKAANKITGFLVLGEEDKEATMIPRDKRQFLTEIGLDPDAVQTQLDAMKAQADKAGLEFKDVEEEVTDVEETTEEEGTKNIQAPNLEALTRSVEALTCSVEDIQQGMVVQQEGLKEVFQVLSQQRQEKDATPWEALFTPAASLREASALRSKETMVEEGEFETPKETKAKTAGTQTGIEFIDAMLAGGDWREPFEGGK